MFQLRCVEFGRRFRQRHSFSLLAMCSGRRKGAQTTGRGCAQVNSIEYQILLLTDHFDFFASLTWANLGTMWTRRHHVTNWLRAMAARAGTHEQRLIYVTRWELGEIGERPHCHVLLGNFPEAFVHLGSCFEALHRWKHGIARVRLFDVSKKAQAASYLSEGGDWSGNAYEIRKFGR